MNDAIIEATHYDKEEQDLTNEQTDDEKKRAIVSRKINHMCQALFNHCKIDLPDGKVLHLGRTVGMNYAKDNGVGTEDIFCMTGHATGDKISNVAKDHYFTHSPPAAMHVMSGAT